MPARWAPVPDGLVQAIKASARDQGPMIIIIARGWGGHWRPAVHRHAESGGRAESRMDRGVWCRIRRL